MSDQLTAERPTSAPPGSLDEAGFDELTGAYRAELLAHCYRMLGSVHDAEDMVQETYLRAWRSIGAFEGRSSVRTWLYRIATNVCLTALEGRARRPLPAGLGHAESGAGDPLEQLDDVPWLQPIPDAATDAGTGDPAQVVAARSGLRLALIAALQHLPPRQRAVLVLRDVLRFRAAEVAGVLETSTAAVNSSLQRARAQLDEARLSEDDIAEPTDPAVRAVVEVYARALERKDVPAVVRLVSADAVWEMPPFTNWYRGREAIAALIEEHCPAGPGELRLLGAAANGQVALAMYWLQDGAWRPFQLQVLDVRRPGSGDGPQLVHVVAFQDPGLFATFGLPAQLPG